MDTIGWIIVWVICAFVAGGMNTSKGRSYGEGFLLGLFLGIIGVIIVAVLPKNEQGLEQEKLKDGTGKRCPYCAEIVKQEAIVCKHCGRDLPVQEKLQGPIGTEQQKEEQRLRRETSQAYFRKRGWCEVCGAKINIFSKLSGETLCSKHRQSEINQ